VINKTIGVFALPTAWWCRSRLHRAASWILIRRPQYVQVARQGNPLFNEGLVAIEDKDMYSRTLPTVDSQLFRKYRRR
jgi:hypothetical protein